MKTQIFKDYKEFLNREDKLVNGVSEEFAKRNPNFESDNETNIGCYNCSHCSGCYNCSHCSGCSHCSHCSDCSHCSHCSDCSDCSGCYNCSDCSDCSDCSGCYNCSDCSGCYNCSDLKSGYSKTVSTITPKIENIHQAVLRAATETESSLDMSDWHTCSTTHCRAGWVVHLAGDEGYKLEGLTSTEFAAMHIYKASSDIRVSPAKFYLSDEESLEDMRKCAERENAN